MKKTEGLKLCDVSVSPFDLKFYFSQSHYTVQTHIILTVLKAAISF